MPAQRLLAKLTRPRLHGAVSRERLFARLDAARGDRPAVCVIGPPGAGKTTLVASWLDSRGAAGVWYQVDPGDADLATFFHYLGQAAAPYARRGQPALPALTPEYREDIAGFSRRFFRELFSRLPEDAVVVLDNYQEVGAEQLFHGLIAQAVEEIPPGMVLVAVSRRDPPDAYARLIANEHVALVDWDQLKLTLDEATAIAAARVELAAPEIERLHATCGGWAAGLTLLIEGRRRNSATSTDLPEGRDAIFDYFAAQIFARVPAATQRFLVATALLPQVPVSVARELTGNADAESILDDLHRRHLFTHRRAGREPVYWYHALFRAFLTAQTDAVLGRMTTQGLLSRAARLFETSGAVDDAFDLFRAARDWPAAIRLIERRAADILSQGRGQRLREWIQSVPEPFLELHPWLGYWLGTSLIAVDQATARRHLECAFERFRLMGDLSGQALSAAGMIDAYVFEWTDFRQIRGWADALDALLDRLQLSDTPGSEQRIVSSLLLGMLYVVPGHPRLPWCVSRATEMLDEELDAEAKLAAAMMLLGYCNLAPDAERAAIAIRSGTSLVTRLEVTPFARLWWFIRLGLQLTEQGRYEDAVAALDDAEDIATAHGFHKMPNVMSILWTYRAIVSVTRGDLAETRTNCARIQEVAKSGGLMAISNAALARLYSQGAARNEEAYATLGMACIEAGRATGMIWLEASAQVYRAIGLATTGQRSALTQLLAQHRSLVQGTCFVHLEIDMSLIETWDVMRHESQVNGLAMLSEVLVRARHSRWQSWNSIRAARVHRELFAEACAAGIEIDYVTDLIRRYRLTPPTCATEHWPWPVKVRTLGVFQVEVDDVPLQFVGKTPKKPLALLKALVSLGTHSVPAVTLIDALWPGEEGDAARKSLDVTIARLRKLLGRSEAVVVSDESVGLNRTLCWVDANSFAESPDDGPAREATLEKYAGTFLPGDLDVSWTLKRREQLRSRFVRLVDAAGAAAEAGSDWDAAIAWYRRGLDADELAETFHQGLMRCHLAAGRFAEGMAAYRRLRQTLSVLLGIAPSEQSQALARALQSEGARREATG